MKNPFYNWLTEEEQKIVFFLIVFGFIGIIVQYTGLLADENPEAADSLQAAVEKDYEIIFDLRTATKEELISIPGIGEKRAADILFYREEHGFKSLSEIKNVKGIGDATFKRLESSFIPFGQEEELNTKDETENQEIEESTQSIHKEKANIEKININTASLEELQKIKGLGPATAEKIINLRNEIGEFSAYEQLLEVKGIGPKTLEKMRPYLEL
jgi:competence protein ComEA